MSKKLNAIFLNNRSMKFPHSKIQKKFGKLNHFGNKKSSRTGLIAEAEALDLDEEKFDKDIAVVAFTSPRSKLNLNPMFLDTRQFNKTTVDYMIFKD